jgi:hypothetical protein
MHNFIFYTYAHCKCSCSDNSILFFALCYELNLFELYDNSIRMKNKTKSSKVFKFVSNISSVRNNNNY